MSTYDIKQKTITNFPFHTLADKTETLESLAVKAHSSWMIPQALALVSKELKLIKDTTELINPLSVVQALGMNKTKEQKNWWSGLLSYLNTAPRGEILGSGTTPQRQYPEYSCLTPLILSVLKRDRKVAYSEWDFSNPSIKYFIDVDLLEAVQCDWAIMTVEQLLDIRDIATTIKTGIKAGTKVSPVETFKKLNIKEYPEFSKMPRLAQLMLGQMYVAHPSVRTDSMILAKDFSIPAPLVADEIIDLKLKAASSSSPTTQVNFGDMPW